MWDPKTSRIHISRDIKWLDKMYFPNNKIHIAPQVGKSILKPSHSLPNDEESVDHPTEVNLEDNNSDTNSNSPPSPTLSSPTKEITSSSKISQTQVNEYNTTNDDKPKEHGEHGESDKGE